MKTNIGVLVNCHRVEFTGTCKQDTTAMILKILQVHADEYGFNVVANLESNVIDIEPRNGISLHVGR
jgi:hypothetical protein